MDADAQPTDVINPALADLAARIGDLVVSNALLVAENRALLARIATLLPAEDAPDPAPRGPSRRSASSSS